MSLHLDFLRPAVRRRQVSQLVDLIRHRERPLAVLGDFNSHDEHTVTKLSRDDPTDLYASGIQIVNPSRLNELCGEVETFYEVWTPLIARRLLRVSRVMPRAWFSVDTLADLQKLR